MNNKLALFYIKDNQIYPIAMSQEQFDMLQVIAPMVFGGEQITVIDEPQGVVKKLKLGGNKND